MWLHPPQVWLQEFAWSEKGRRLKLQARERMAEHVPQLLSEPIFCFETAVRMLYWCAVSYVPACMHRFPFPNSVHFGTAQAFHESCAVEAQWRCAPPAPSELGHVCNMQVHHRVQI